MREPYENLANAIIIMAARDYRAALKRRAKKPTPMVEEEIRSIERFFRSAWYEMLTEVDGEMLIRKLRKEVEDN